MTLLQEQKDVISLQADYYDEDTYRIALEKAIREFPHLMDENRRSRYQNALRRSMEKLDSIQAQIAAIRISLIINQ